MFAQGRRGQNPIALDQRYAQCPQCFEFCLPVSSCPSSSHLLCYEKKKRGKTQLWILWGFFFLQLIWMIQWPATCNLLQWEHWSDCSSLYKHVNFMDWTRWCICNTNQIADCVTCSSCTWCHHTDYSSQIIKILCSNESFGVLSVQLTDLIFFDRPVCLQLVSSLGYSLLPFTKDLCGRVSWLALFLFCYFFFKWAMSCWVEPLSWNLPQEPFNCSFLFE